MTRFNSKKDLPTILLYLLIIIIGSAVLVYGLSQLMNAEAFYDYSTAIFFSLLGIVTPLALFYCLFKTYYIFEEDGLRIKSGIFGTKILYSNIFVIKDSAKIIAMYALSLDRFEITHKDVTNKTNPWAHNYISPLDKEAFLKELRKHCKNVRIVRSEQAPVKKKEKK